MADIGKAYVQIVPTTKGIKGDVEKALTDNSSGIGSKMGSKISSGIKKGIKIGAVGIGAQIVGALKIGAELEQQLGGAEAVFEKFSSKLVTSSKTAFTDMGLSQNAFLQGANKMGSLFQGAGHSVGSSLKMSMGYMRRASDVASIMGIDTEDALTAVSAAAKGNFTMMDNLGVAMNATSLEAFALSKGIKKSYNSMSMEEKTGLAYQMFMEKTAKYAGNYAKENDTLSGSLNTLKSGFSTLLGQLGQGQDITGTLDGLKETFKKFSGALTESLKSIGKEMPAIISEIGPQFSELANTIVPILTPIFVTAFGAIFDAVITSLPGLISGLIGQLPSMFGSLVDSFSSADLGGKIGLTIVGGLAVFNLATKLSPLIGTALKAIKIPALPAGGGTGFSGFMTGLANGIMAFANPQILLGAAIIAGSMVILSAGVWASVKIVSDSLPGLGTALAGFNTINGANLLVVGGGLIALGAGLAAITAGAVINGLASFVGADFGSALKAIIEPIAQLMPTLTPEAIGKFSLLGTGLAALGLGYATIKGFTNGSAIANSITTLNTAVIAVGDGAAYSTVSNGLVTLGNGITKLSSIKINVAGVASQLTSMTNKIKTLNNFNWSAATSKVKTNGQSIGKNVIQGIVSGINSEAYQLDITISNKIDSMVAAAVKKAKIHSPSRLFRDEVGYWIGAAIPLGASDGIDAYSNALPNAISKMTSSVSSVDLDSSARGAGFPDVFKLVDSNIEMIVKAVVKEQITRNNVDYQIIK